MAAFEERPLKGDDGQQRLWKIVSSPATTFSLSTGSENAPNQPPETLSALEPLFPRLALQHQVQWVKVFLAKLTWERILIAR